MPPINEEDHNYDPGLLSGTRTTFGRGKRRPQNMLQEMLRMRLEDWLCTPRQVIIDSFCHLGRTLLEGSTRTVDYPYLGPDLL